MEGRVRCSRSLLLLRLKKAGSLSLCLERRRPSPESISVASSGLRGAVAHRLVLLAEAVAGVRVERRERGERRGESRPCPCSSTLLVMRPGYAGFLGCERTLPGRAASHRPRGVGLLLRAALGAFCVQPGAVFGIATCRTLPVALLNLPRFALANCQACWGPPCVTCLPCSMWSAPESLVLLADWLKAHSMAPCVSVPKMLKSGGGNANVAEEPECPLIKFAADAKLGAAGGTREVVEAFSRTLRGWRIGQRESW